MNFSSASATDSARLVFLSETKKQLLKYSMPSFLPFSFISRMRSFEGRMPVRIPQLKETDKTSDKRE